MNSEGITKQKQYKSEVKEHLNLLIFKVLNA